MKVLNNCRFAELIECLTLIVTILAIFPLQQVRAQDAFAYAKSGEAKSDKGDLDGAIADYTLAIQLNPKFARAYHIRGNAKFRKGDLDGAIADLSQAIQLGPKDAEAYSLRGAAKQSKGDLDGAIADRNQARQLDPNVKIFGSTNK